MTDRRRATPEDLDAVVAVFLACWRTAYRGVLPDATVDAMTDDDAIDLWRASLADPSGEALVAERDGRVTGVVRWTRDDVTVQSLYVDPGDQGHGTGTGLLAAAVDELAAGGSPVARLWVFEANAAARAFYAARGWVPDGANRTEDRFGAPECRLVLTMGRR
jgi:GNAT superfamily N-acetyltransferase